VFTAAVDFEFVIKMGVRNDAAELDGSQSIGGKIQTVLINGLFEKFSHLFFLSTIFQPTVNLFKRLLL
jgi:protoporphyrinogen oxidase